MFPGLEPETLSTSPKKFTDSATQFDSAVSMCDLTHRGVVVEEQLFLAKGGNQQYYEWEECGLFLYIPENAISPLSSCEVRVSALAGGDFIFPDDYELVSAVYAVTFSHSLQHAIVIELQHCVDLQTRKHVDFMSFAVASPLPIPGSYKFIPIKGGRFNVQDRFGSIEASKSLCYCIILRECVLEAGNNGSCGGQSNACSVENEQNDHVEDDLSENEEGSGSGQDGGAAGGDGGSENSSSQDDEQPESETNSESKDDEEESDALVEENEVKEKNHQVNDSEDVCQEETMCEDSVGDGSQNQSGEPVMNCEIVNAIDDSESVDIEAVVSCIKEEIHKKSAALKSLFDTSIKSVSANMSAAGLISHAVMKNPSYESIIADVNHHLMFVESLPQILEHCEKFFRALLNLGGPFVRAQKLLQKNIAQSIQEKLNFEMPFRDIEEKAAELTRKPETKHGASIKQWYMCQHFVHGINRAKWDVEVAFAKELNVLKSYLDRKARRKMDERTIVVFRFSKEYLTIEKPQPIGSDIGWSVVPDLGHPYKIYREVIDLFGQSQSPQPIISKYQAFRSLKPESDDIFTYSLKINDILKINDADEMGMDLHIAICSTQEGKTQGNDGEVDSPGGSSILDKRPILKHAVHVLIGHSTEWSDIGRELDVPLNERDGLRRDTGLSNNDRLEKVIDYWLEKERCIPVTWDELIEILEGMSFTGTVRSIREEFLKGKRVLEAYMN